MSELTTRAYTLKLSGMGAWRDPIWTTHCIVNRGVQVWGDWLLTLRGGLPATLATDEPDRRAVLALSWLSVESPSTLVPQEHRVTSEADSEAERQQKVMTRFREILQRAGAPDQEAWIADCEPALTARIRADAVWVDRFAAFRECCKELNGLTPEIAADLFFDLVGHQTEYFKVHEAELRPRTEGKDFVIKAGNWLSKNWGAGKKSDAASIGDALSKLLQVPASRIADMNGEFATFVLLEAMGNTIDPQQDAREQFKQLKRLIGWKGRSSKGAVALQKLQAAPSVSPELWQEVQTKLLEDLSEQSSKSDLAQAVPSWMPAFRKSIEEKIGMPFRVQRDNIWEYAVMLDHALRRISAAHTWIKRAEASRRGFKEDASKLASVPDAARRWLDWYCEGRSQSSGATDQFGYLISKRALEGWDEVVKAWSKLREGSAQARVEAVRDLQREWPDDKKFGDAQLFGGSGHDNEESPSSLAADSALPVWQDELGKANASILKDYVAAKIAERDQWRFKVPAYRHPDPLRHPVFVDFGNSRWGITYAALETVRRRKKLRVKLQKAKSSRSRERIETELVSQPDLHAVTLSLWNGAVVEPETLRWHGKRLRKDLDLNHFEQPGPTVSRADRMGRAVGGGAKGPVNVASMFELSDWSGRLQAPRRELERLADLVYGKKRPAHDGAWDGIHGQAATQWQRIKWFLSLSAKLQPAGAWLDYAATLPEGWEYKTGRKGRYLHIEANRARKGRARLMLARLAALRVLSVDLGERHAAACAVWHTLSGVDFKKEIARGKIVAGGTSDQDLFCHVATPTDKMATGGRNKGKPIDKTTIYRRIGPDKLDGKPHPAPWARLDRQFLIKLQGEDRPARPARPEEFEVYRNLCSSLGREVEEPRQELDLNGATTFYPRIDGIMHDGVNAARQGLRRHGNCARIAFALASWEKPISGGRTVRMSREQRSEALQDALVLWEELAGSTKYRDDWAKGMWDEWVVGKFGGPQPVEIDDDAPRSERRKKLDDSRGLLQTVAEQLIDRPNSDLHKLWADEWQNRIQTFQQLLRRLRKLILPRIGKRPLSTSPEFAAWKAKAKGLRRVGGLSYQRLAAIRELYQLMRAFHMRPEPDNLRAGIERIERQAEYGHRFGLRILQTLDRLRENRVKQLASRVVEASLGVGSEDARHWENGRKRPRTRIDDPRFAPCHAIIVEDLERYRPDEKRPRRENRRLMNWAARNVRRYLMEGCELYGLYFDEVDPRYTSRQDSRTGLPGMRCEDLAIEGASKSVARWQRVVAEAKRRIDNGGKDRLDQMLVDLSARHGSANEETRPKPQFVRVPRKGGSLFVAANSLSRPRAALQADLNAAANIGLRALFDPDWEGTWWYIPVKAADGKPLREKLAGCAVIDLDKPLIVQITSDKKEIINVWRNPSVNELSQSKWMQYIAYWDAVQSDVICGLRIHNRLEKTP